MDLPTTRARRHGFDSPEMLLPGGDEMLLLPQTKFARDTPLSVCRSRQPLHFKGPGLALEEPASISLISTSYALGAVTPLRRSEDRC